MIYFLKLRFEYLAVVFLFNFFLVFVEMKEESHNKVTNKTLLLSLCVCITFTIAATNSANANAQKHKNARTLKHTHKYVRHLSLQTQITVSTK